MLRRELVVGVALSLVAPPWLAAEDPFDAELRKGIHQARAGEFESGVVTLDAVAKGLATQGGRTKDLARAYLYLSMAYLGLKQEQKAKDQYLEAWRLDSGLDLAAEEFPVQVRQFFEETKAEAKKSGEEDKPEQPVPAPTPSGIPTLAPGSEKKSGSRLPLILIGVGGAAATGVVLASRGEGCCSSVVFTSVSPPSGTTIVAVPLPGPPVMGLLPRNSGLVSVGLSLTLAHEVSRAQLYVYLLSAGQGVGYCGQNLPDSPTWQSLPSGWTTTYTVTGFQVYSLPCDVTGIRAILHTRKNSGLVIPPTPNETIAEATFPVNWRIHR